MAKKTLLKINLNKCRVLNSNGDLVKPDLYGGESEAHLGYVYKDNEWVKVFNRAEYALSIRSRSLKLEAYAQMVDPVLFSYKADFDPETRLFIDNEEDIPYEGAFYLDSNTSGEVRKGEFTILQPESGLSFDCSYEQEYKQILNYSIKEIADVSVNYEEVEGSGGTSAPSVLVTATIVAYYTDETSVEYDDYFVGTVTYAAGRGENDSGAVIDEDTGVVSVGERSDDGQESLNVFYVESLQGTFHVPVLEEDKQIQEWSWDEGLYIKQMPKEADQKIYLDGEDYQFTSGIEDDNILATDSKIRVTYSGKRIRQYYWASNPSVILNEEEKLDMYLRIEGVSGMTVLDKSKSEEYVYVGMNTSASERTIALHVYYIEDRYDKRYVVTQAAADVSEQYEAPTLNAAIELEEIGFDGSRKSVYVPIRQRRYKYNEVTGDKTYLEDYTTTVLAVGIGGKAESGTGFSFSNGHVSADSMGRTEYKNGRKVYTLTSVFVDGIGYPNHEIPLGDSMEIRQAANNKYTLDYYVLAVSADPSEGISALGGTSTISYSAQIKTEEWYDADPSVSVDYTDTSASLSTTIGSIASSVSGKGTTTLTFGREDENNGYERDAIVTLSKGGEKATCSVTQDAAYYEFRRTDDSDLDMSATESIVRVSFLSTKNEKAWQPRFEYDSELASVGDLTKDGNVYTFPITVFANPNTSARNIVVTAIQDRHYGDVTIPLEITQAGSVITLPKAGVSLVYCKYMDDKLQSVQYRLNFTAKDTTKYSGGELKDVQIQFRDSNDMSGNKIDSDKLLGTINVPFGGESAYYEGTFNTKGKIGYIQVYWDDKLQFASQAEEFNSEI